MNEEIYLKPCPFCGSSNAPQIMTLADVNCRDIDDPEFEDEDAVYAVVCTVSFGGCGCSTGQMPESPEDAAKLWNSRAENTNTASWTATLEKVDNLFGLMQNYITCPVCRKKRIAGFDEKTFPKYCDECGTKMKAESK